MTTTPNPNITNSTNSSDSNSSTTLLFSPSISSPSLSPSNPSGSPGISHFTIASTNNVVNTTGTDPTATHPSNPGGNHDLSSGMIALLIGVALLGGAILSLFIYLKVTDKLYKLIPFKHRLRRTSISSSHRPLDLEDQELDEHHEDESGHGRNDDMPQTREGNMFTIDDFEPVQNEEYSRPNNEEYFYDEVFGKSMFEDEATNASMRHLYLATEANDDDMFDVDAIVNGITGSRSSRVVKRT